MAEPISPSLSHDGTPFHCFRFLISSFVRNHFGQQALSTPLNIFLWNEPIYFSNVSECIRIHSSEFYWTTLTEYALKVLTLSGVLFPYDVISNLQARNTVFAWLDVDFWERQGQFHFHFAPVEKVSDRKFSCRFEFDVILTSCKHTTAERAPPWKLISVWVSCLISCKGLLDLTLTSSRIESGPVDYLEILGLHRPHWYALAMLAAAK